MAKYPTIPIPQSREGHRQFPDPKSAQEARDRYIALAQKRADLGPVRFEKIQFRPAKLKDRQKFQKSEIELYYPVGSGDEYREQGTFRQLSRYVGGDLRLLETMPDFAFWVREEI